MLQVGYNTQTTSLHMLNNRTAEHISPMLDIEGDWSYQFSGKKWKNRIKCCVLVLWYHTYVTGGVNSADFFLAYAEK